LCPPSLPLLAVWLAGCASTPAPQYKLHLGGSPEAFPELYRIASPITYVSAGSRRPAFRRQSLPGEDRGPAEGRPGVGIPRPQPAGGP